ncbi:hypothetical protein B5M09_007276 [Aphanomyces astaci]|uniref:Uncharacterized protein n=1 Tax=Aphanomyces astaci TaxID=112090 RepID=A0A3R7XKL8_APHAT|nr:hypothetical protein B5M09_007276 [Aphanomyces astaci]
MEITEDLLKRRSKHFDIACIQRLNLAGCDIRTVALLEGCTSLVELNLAKNHVRCLAYLQLTMPYVVAAVVAWDSDAANTQMSRLLV